MLRDLIKLKFLLALLYRLGSFNIVVLDLLPKEASGLEILHRLTGPLAILIVILNVTNHSRVALRVKSFF